MLQNEFWYDARMDDDGNFTVTVGLGDGECEKTFKLREFLMQDCNWTQEENRDKFVSLLREVADHFVETAPPGHKYQSGD